MHEHSTQSALYVQLHTNDMHVSVARGHTPQTSAFGGRVYDGRIYGGYANIRNMALAIRYALLFICDSTHTHMHKTRACVLQVMTSAAPLTLVVLCLSRAHATHIFLDSWPTVTHTITYRHR